MKKQAKQNCQSHRYLFPKKGLIALFLMWGCSLFAQNNTVMEKNDDELINQYIKAKGTETISFDASNIKQFWVDNSVRSENNSINITLKTNAKTYESVPMRLALINVLETQNCTMDIITENEDLSFTISNIDSKPKKLSQSSVKENFIKYHVVSTSFPLEDLASFAFDVTFSSNKSEQISIKSIILSFSNNPQSKFAGSPGFNALIEQFDKEGETVPNKDVKCIVSKENKVFYFKIPDDMASSFKFFCHVYPTNKSDLVKPESQYNNADAPLNEKKSFIPKPVSSDCKYSIIQYRFPEYPFRVIHVGQFIKSENIWQYKYSNDTK